VAGYRGRTDPNLLGRCAGTFRAYARNNRLRAAGPSAYGQAYSRT